MTPPRIGKSAARLRRLWMAYHGLCHWCAAKTVLPPPGVILDHQPDGMATRDHIIDRFNGRGSHTPNRCVLACRRCNDARSREAVALHIHGRVELWCHA